MSEWLGTGLQNRSQRFESAWHLSIKSPHYPAGFSFIHSFILYTLYIYTLTNTLPKTTVGWRFVVAPQESFPLAPTHGNYAINNPG